MSKYMRKYPSIIKAEGLKISEKVLKLLKKDKSLSEYEIVIGCFTNCRECGYTFYPINKNDQHINNSMTFCVYEHRNSDNIIINGKSGFISMNGDLPFIADDKWQNLGQVSWNEYEKAAEILSNLIKNLK